MREPRQAEMTRRSGPCAHAPDSALPCRLTLCCTATRRPMCATTSKAKPDESRVERNTISKSYLSWIGTTGFSLFFQCAGCVLLSEESSVGIHIQFVVCSMYNGYVCRQQDLHAWVCMSAACSVITPLERDAFTSLKNLARIYDACKVLMFKGWPDFLLLWRNFMRSSYQCTCKATCTHCVVFLMHFALPD